MKKTFISALCIFLFSSLPAQSNVRDSLRNLLFHEKGDIVRVKLLRELSNSFIKSNPDSSIIYAEDALQLSRKINFPVAEITVLYELSFDYNYTGNYSLALERAFTALKISEEIKDTLQIARSYFAIANAYDAQHDRESGLEYYMKSSELFKNLNNLNFLEATMINIGLSYLNLNKLDSARIFTNEALELALRMNDNAMIGAAYQNLGLTNTRMKVYDLAKNYFHLAIVSFADSSNHSFMSDVQVRLAEVFDSTRQFDSAFYYARDSYRRAKLINVPDRIMPAAKELVSLFKKNRQVDSALLYQDMVIELNDSLSSQEKQKQIQNITFSAKLEQMEKEKREQERIEERKRNLQITGVAIFIPLFFGVVLLLSRRQIKTQAVEFLGVLFLLFVFEFITLYFHPIIANLTHDSPIWMLLIFVTIAFILVPLHHRSENWIRKQIALQRTKELQKRVRLGEEARKKLSQ